MVAGAHQPLPQRTPQGLCDHTWKVFLLPNELSMPNTVLLPNTLESARVPRTLARAAKRGRTTSTSQQRVRQPWAGPLHDKQEAPAPIKHDWRRLTHDTS